MTHISCNNDGEMNTGNIIVEVDLYLNLHLASSTLLVSL